MGIALFQTKKESRLSSGSGFLFYVLGNLMRSLFLKNGEL